MALKFFEANINCENGVDDKSGFTVIDRKLGVTSFGRKVLRLRGAASQGSDCDSDGLPGYMQGGCEDDDDMELILARREVEDFSLLVPEGGKKEALSAENEGIEGNLFSRDEEGILTPRSAKRWVAMKENQVLAESNAAGVVQSSSGGIPLEKVVVEDYVSSDDEGFQETAQEAMENLTVSRAAKSAFAENKRKKRRTI